MTDRTITATMIGNVEDMDRMLTTPRTENPKTKRSSGMNMVTIGALCGIIALVLVLVIVL